MYGRAFGPVVQLARTSALHAEDHRFESGQVHRAQLGDWHAKRAHVVIGKLSLPSMLMANGF